MSQQSAFTANILNLNGARSHKSIYIPIKRTAHARELFAIIAFDPYTLQYATTKQISSKKATNYFWTLKWS